MKAGKLCFIFLAFFCISVTSYSLDSPGAPIEVEDIIAGIKNSESLLKDYELCYTTKKTFLYRTISSASPAANLNPPSKYPELKLATEDEKQKLMISRVNWRTKGVKFSYSGDFEDHINDTSFSEKRAFNGELNLGLKKQDGFLRGSVAPPDTVKTGSYPRQSVSPSDFLDKLGFNSIADWLKKDSVKILPNMEMVSGRWCYVVECVHRWAKGKYSARGKFWLSPELGFRALKHEFYLHGNLFRIYEVTEVKEILEGLWFPIKGLRKDFVHHPDSDSPIFYSILEYEVDPNSLRVNRGISDEEFTFTFPPGTEVYDAIIDHLYVVRGIDEYYDIKMDTILPGFENKHQCQLKCPAVSH